MTSGGLYRIYIDEVGNGTVKTKSMENNSRFLTLTGVVMEAEYVKEQVAPGLDALKRTHFSVHHPDDPIILHASELKGKSKSFACLKDPERRLAFDAALFGFISSLDATIISVTVDKPNFALHQARYGQNPYTTCLLNLLERYYLFLQDHSARGDVMIEGGDPSRDRTVREMYTEIYSNTAGLIRCFSDRFTSKEIKIKPKVQNIAGLQIADVVGLPIRKHELRKHNIEVSISTFESTFYDIIEPKIRRASSGKVEGYGTKWLE
jgi:preprotein translocase subunit Sec61beta